MDCILQTVEYVYMGLARKTSKESAVHWRYSNQGQSTMRFTTA